MKYIFNTPDTLFSSTTLVTKMTTEGNEVTFHGEPHPDVNNPSKHGWQTHGFGFVTSDVKSESLFEQIYHLQKMVQYAKDRASNFNKPIEFLVHTISGTLSIYWREQKPNF